MRLIYLIFCCIGIIGCSPTVGQVLESNDCQLIQSILDAEVPHKILGLDKADEVYPYIRITDLTGKFTDCASYYKRQSPSLLISYFVEPQLKTNLNTGHFRDIVVLNFKQEEDRIKLLLSAASFATNNNVNTTYQVELEFKKIERGDYELLSQKAVEWNDRSPSVDYDKIKN